jgi:CRP/FNR family transcriptional regulator, cyclic AMP receptor protein
VIPDPTAAILSQTELFSGLTDQELADLARCLRRRRFPKGQMLFLRGDPGTSLYVVTSGQIRIAITSPDGQEMVLSILGPLDVFGDLALLDGQPRSADAVVHEPAELLILERGDFQRFLEGHPRAAITLLAIMARRLRHNAEIIQDAAFFDVPARLARVILRLAEAPGHADDAGSTHIRLTQVELAGMVGATRESVNKWLGFFRRRGAITYERGQITVLRADELRRRAQ